MLVTSYTHINGVGGKEQKKKKKKTSIVQKVIRVIQVSTSQV